MSITWANFRVRLNDVVGDVPVTATTTAAGSTDKTTAVATSLIEQYDDFIEGSADFNKYLYVPSVAEERRIFHLGPETGTVFCKRPFTAQVATATPIEIHRYRVSDKLKAANRALEEVYQRKDFYSLDKEVSLWGQDYYGEGDEQFHKRKYTVSGFDEFPVIRLVDAYTGEHTGSDGASALTDANQSFKTNELVGYKLFNKTDGSSGTVTANTATVVTATLSGGTGDDWDEDDEYIIQKPSAIPSPFTNYERTSTTEFYAQIPEDKVLLLTGRGELTQFSTETSATELDNDQARIVAYYAGYCLFNSMASQIIGAQRDDFLSLGNECLAKYLEWIKPMAKSCMMPINTRWMND